MKKSNRAKAKMKPENFSIQENKFIGTVILIVVAVMAINFFMITFIHETFIENHEIIFLISSIVTIAGLLLIFFFMKSSLRRVMNSYAK